MTTDHRPHYDELLPAYALGALDAGELAELEGHLSAGCPECELQLATWRQTAEGLADSVTPVVVSELTRARVLAAARRSARRRLPGLGVAAALLLLAGAIGLIVSLERRIDRLGAEQARLVERLAVANDRLAAAESEVAQARRALGVVASADVRSVTLAGLPPAPGSSGRAWLDPSSGRAVFYAHGLPSLPSSRTYQLWVITGGRPLSAGVFAVDSRGDASLEVGPVAAGEKIEAWAVTVEPAGGQPQPTGEMVLKG